MAQEPYLSSDYADLFFDLFEDSSDAVFIVRAGDGVIIDANEAFLSLSGLTRHQAIGHSALELGLWVRPSDRIEYVKTLKEQRRVKGYWVRFRNPWRSDEFTLALSSTLTRLRGDDVILGIGRVVRL